MLNVIMKDLNFILSNTMALDDFEKDERTYAKKHLGKSDKPCISDPPFGGTCFTYDCRR